MDERTARLEPFFPKSHGCPGVDDRRVLSGIIFVNRNGLRWRDAPAERGPARTIHNRWKRWSGRGVFARTVADLAAGAEAPRTVMIDATDLQAHRTASSLRSKKKGVRVAAGAPHRAHKRRAQHQLHAVTNTEGRPIRFFPSAGQVSDYTDALALLDTLLRAHWLLADRGYNVDWLRDVLLDRGTRPCIPGRTSRERRVKRRHRPGNASR